MTTFNYQAAAAPEGYRCDGCGKHSVKLWREYQAFDPQLLCMTCAATNQKKQIVETTDKGRVRFSESSSPNDFSDQIGWYVPAVPDEKGQGYWGYTSVPDEGVRWWQRLPNDTSAPDAQTTLTQALEADTELLQKLLSILRSGDRVKSSLRLQIQARIAANRTLLQAASAEPDAAGSEG